MTQYKTMEDIKAAVEANGGLLTLKMEALRDAYGAGRLAKIVRENILKTLRGLGLGHLPAGDLPNEQEESVRLYKLGTPIGDLIDAVITPSPAHDEEIRQVIKADNSVILNQIRELVC